MLRRTARWPMCGGREHSDKHICIFRRFTHTHVWSCIRIARMRPRTDEDFLLDARRTARWSQVLWSEAVVSSRDATLYIGRLFTGGRTIHCMVEMSGPLGRDWTTRTGSVVRQSNVAARRLVGQDRQGSTPLHGGCGPPAPRKSPARSAQAALGRTDPKTHRTRAAVVMRAPCPHGRPELWRRNGLVR